jgi:ribosomal-protein-alanine N-acetyltransferase
MRPDFIRRTLGVTDLPQVLTLDRRSISPWTLNNFLGELNRPFTTPVGVFLADVLVGHLWAWLLPPETHLLKIAVAEAFEGQGLAAGLLSNLVELTRAVQGDRILLEVAADNQRAIRLYRLAGFQFDGRSRNYYGQADAWLMSLKIADWPGLKKTTRFLTF